MGKEKSNKNKKEVIKYTTILVGITILCLLTVLQPINKNISSAESKVELRNILKSSPFILPFLCISLVVFVMIFTYKCLKIQEIKKETKKETKKEEQTDNTNPDVP